MAVASEQLISFYSYRYFVPPFSRRAPTIPPGTEREIRDKVSEGDEAFASRRYTPALSDYLEAYSLLYQLLHPDVPVDVIVRKPHLVDGLDIFKPLLTASVQAARFRDRRAGVELIPTLDLPPRLLTMVGKLGHAPRPAVRPAELAYRGATGYLQLGAVEEATNFLQAAEEGAPARDRVFAANLTLTRAALQVATGESEAAAETLERSRQLYARLKLPVAEAAVAGNLGTLLTLKGDVEGAGKALQAAGDLVPESLDRTLFQNLNPGTASMLSRPMGRDGLDLLVPDLNGKWLRIAPAAAGAARPAETLRVHVGDGVREIDLSAAGAEDRFVEAIYQPRVAATALEALYPHFEIGYNLVAHLPHLYGFVLPMSIGDCHAALGRRSDALQWYLKARDYEFLNLALEAPKVWLKAARAAAEEGDHHFRKRDPATAKQWYERVLLTDGTVPLASQLYQGPKFATLVAVVQAAVAAMDGGPAFTGNHEIGALVAHVRAQLTKIAHGLNWLGLADDVAPIWTFDFLQTTARYFAGHAIQGWREYISYRAAAEQAEFAERELEQAVTMNELALDTQEAQEELAESQQAVVEAMRDGAVLHRDNLVDARNQFNTDGWVIAELNRFQAWYGNASSDVSYSESVHWDWGGGRELTIGPSTLQERVDAVIRYRNRLSHEMQIDNFDRQIAEAASQILVADRQLQVAQAQLEVAHLQTLAAEQRLEFSKDNLEFFKTAEFTPDLWHALADRLREVANRYLDMAIYAAFLMERAYVVENDRELHRIRFDYVSPGVGELTAGDSLLMDIDSFTHDLLSHVKGRRNRIRHVISLADFAPHAFTQFVQTGAMEFKLPLWAFDRAYPGTFLHRIQDVEIEIEGLQVPEGMTGRLTHLGISEWRGSDGSIRSRTTAPETMVLSGFRLRRDLVLYRADPARLGLFEGSGTASSWRLELPLSTNDVDFTAISDVRLVLYFYALHDPELEATIRAGFPASDQAAQSFSARLHAPDEYFAFGPPPDGSDTITFELGPGTFPFNQIDPQSTEVGVHVLRLSDTGAAEPFPAVALTVQMAGQEASGATDADGVLATDGGAGPLAALAGQPVGAVEVEFTGPPEVRAEVADVFLLLNYTFDYRQP